MDDRPRWLPEEALEAFRHETNEQIKAQPTSA